MLRKLFNIVIIALIFASCGKQKFVSSATDWPYDYKSKRAFRSIGNLSTTVPPGMIEIPGWSFAIDDADEYETATRRIRPNQLNSRRTLAVNTFYMDQYEVRTIDWREYQSWLTAVYSNVAPNWIEDAKPDLDVWRKGLGDNEPFLMNYFTHPSFNEYPIVCVSWDQAVAYCAWRTDRANEIRLIKEGVIKAPDFKAISEMTDLESVENAVFKSERFYTGLRDNLAATYIGLFPTFRLPSEDEWEFAAYARKKNEPANKIKIYPWATTTYERLTDQQQCQLEANYNNSSSDTKNNVYLRTVPVGFYAANDFGLYNMAGNVNEWVIDQYTTRANLNRIDSVNVLDVFLPQYHKHPDNRVYKGGSWKDPIYWMHPSSRRYLDRHKSDNDIGFRCAMSMSLSRTR